MMIDINFNLEIPVVQEQLSGFREGVCSMELMRDGRVPYRPTHEYCRRGPQVLRN